MKVLLFMDKLSSSPSKDEEDTLLEAKEIEAALLRLGHSVVISSFSLNLERDNEIIDEERPNVIFNLVETLNSNSSLHLPSLIFEQRGLKYTGGNSASLFLTSDKVLCKKFLKKNRIPTAGFYYRGSTSISSKLIGKEVIIKPISDEASRGIDDDSIKIFKSKDEMKSFIDNNPNLFIENFIDGREYNVSVMSIDSKVTVLPIAEMKFVDFPSNKPKILNYSSKWEEESFEYKNTRRSFDVLPGDEELIAQLKSISKRCYTELGGKGYLRVDFRVDKNNRPYVLEVNINPCITSDSGFTAACKQYGMNYDKMIKSIVEEANNG